MFQNLYSEDVYKKLLEKLECKNYMQIPRIERICLNVGLGYKAFDDSKALDYVLQSLTLIAGQKAVPTYAKASIAAFKLRKGFPIGCKVTLRRKQLINSFYHRTMIALAQQRNYLGFKRNQFDGKGNFSFGISEHTIYSEINYDEVYHVFGMNVNIITTSNSDDKAFILLSNLNLPFVVD